MPRRIDDDEEMPRRRRRGAKAAAIEVEQERGLVMRMLLHSPKDMVAGLLAAAAICAILANALFLQAGRHPSPMFGSVVTLPAPQAAVSPLPRPRPVELILRPGGAEPPEIRPVEVRGADPKPIEIRSADPRGDSKNPDPLANLVVKSTGAPTAAPANVARPPAPIPATAQSAGARRVASRAARAHPIWLRPVEADRRGRFGHPGCDLEIRARPQAPGDRPDVRSPGEGAHGDDRASDRLASA